MNSKLTLVLLVLLGAFILFFGINKFADFLPPFEGTDIFNDLFAILQEKSAFMSIIGVLEIIFGFLLMIGKFIPLSLTIITAIMFNACLLHLLLDPANIGGAAMGLVLSLAGVFGHKERFKDLLSM